MRNIVLGVIVFVFLICPSSSFAEEEIYKSLSTFTRILDIVERNYVEDVDSKQLTREAIEGMLSSLDPYSVYLSPDQYKEFEEGTSGEFGGIGIEITNKDGYLTVITPIEDTPAFKAGIKPNDQIIKIEGASTKGMAVFEVVKLLRGPVGTHVNLTIQKADGSGTREVTLERSIIHIRSIKSEIKDNGIGYVRLTHFQDKSAEEMVKAIDKLQSGIGSDLNGLILDLRNNPGGLLSQAVEITDSFVDEGLIVSVRGRALDQTIEYFATSKTPAYSFPLIVLLNKGSASASEVVAEALQDQKRAVILGTESFGKGSVQTIIKLEDGSGIKLTTARFYAPSGRSINEIGVTPDVIVENKEGQDIQLQRALELMVSTTR